MAFLYFFLAVILALSGHRVAAEELDLEVSPELENSVFEDGSLRSPLDIAQNPAKPSPPAFEYIWARVRRDINTECKSCPYAECTNKDWYQSSFQFRATCYAKGGVVNNTNLWLKSEAGCYISGFDTIPYWRSYTEDLSPCGYVASKYTQQSSSARQSTPCRICPHPNCEIVRTYRPRSRATLTCYASSVVESCLDYCPRTHLMPGDYSNDNPPPPEITPEPPSRMDWFKTSSNCYVDVKSFGKPRRMRIDDCGPVPYLQKQYHSPPPPPPPPKPEAPPPPKALVPPPPPQCATCAPFIWTIPGGASPAASQTTKYSQWPFSPAWITTATQVVTPISTPSPQSLTESIIPDINKTDLPKLATSHLTVPATPVITPSLPPPRETLVPLAPAFTLSTQPIGQSKPAAVPEPVAKAPALSEPPMRSPTTTMLAKVDPTSIPAPTMVLTMSVFVEPENCLCGAIRCPEDPKLRAACTRFAQAQCQSDCAPGTRFYTTTVNAAGYLQDTPAIPTLASNATVSLKRERMIRH